MTTAKRPAQRKRPTRLTFFRIALGLAIILAVALAGEELRPHIPAIENWIQDQGAWAPIIFIVLMVMLSIVCFPLDVVFIAGGLIFNLGWGFVYVIIGIFIGQSIDFLLGKTLFKKRVERWIEKKPKLRGIHLALKTEGTKLLFMLRMAPIPASPTSYLMGASPMRYGQFLVATLGLLPVSFASMYFGFAAAHATKTVDNPKHIFNLHDASIFGGVVLAIAIMAYIGHRARDIIHDAEEKAGETPDEEI